MLKGILSIAGKPGLFRLVNPGKNMLIVESIQTGRRMPAYARDKVISLGDISMYTVGGDVPLADVMESLITKTEGKPVELKGMSDADMRQLFGEVLPDFDRDRVYTNDIRKLYSWFNLLLAAGIDTFKAHDDEQEESSVEETTEK